MSKHKEGAITFMNFTRQNIMAKSSILSSISGCIVFNVLMCKSIRKFWLTKYVFRKSIHLRGFQEFLPIYNLKYDK